MGYLTEDQLNAMNFRRIGKNVRISDRASIYDATMMELGDHTRIDDFCVVSGMVKTGRNVHFAVFCNVAGGSEGITFGDFAGLAYGCHIFSQSDDYTGGSLTNATVPIEYKKETRRAVRIEKHCIVGTNSLVFPGVVLAEGTAVGANSVVTVSTEAWSMYLGNPARKFQHRSQALLDLEKAYLKAEEAGLPSG